MSEEHKVMYASDEAAKRVTVTGWVCRDGRFYGDDEHLARWAGCTHMTCECGNEHRKGRTICDACSKKKDDERYLARPFKEWAGEPLFLNDSCDRYFFDEGDLLEWCADHEIDDPSTLQLVICEPQYARTIEGDDYFCDDLPEDQSLDDVAPEIGEALDQLNKVIRETARPLSWHPGKFRTSYTRQPVDAA